MRFKKQKRRNENLGIKAFVDGKSQFFHVVYFETIRRAASVLAFDIVKNSNSEQIHQKLLFTAENVVIFLLQLFLKMGYLNPCNL